MHRLLALPHYLSAWRVGHSTSRRHARAATDPITPSTLGHPLLAMPQAPLRKMSSDGYELLKSGFDAPHPHHPPRSPVPLPPDATPSSLRDSSGMFDPPGGASENLRRSPHLPQTAPLSSPKAAAV